MERQEIQIRFADLRRLANAVPAYLTAQAGVRNVPALSAGVEQAFGMAGLDTEELILGFSSTYHVDITAFDFTGLLVPEGPDLLDTLLFLPLIVYLSLGWLLKIVATLLCWPINRYFARRIWQEQVLAFPLLAARQFPVNGLTFGDFVASAAAGCFLRREQVHFRLVR